MVKKVIVNDMMQKNYIYEVTEKEGDNFDKNFKPGLTPKEMLALGVFGGKYLNDCRAKQRQAILHWAIDSRKI